MVPTAVGAGKTASDEEQALRYLHDSKSRGKVRSPQPKKTTKCLPGCGPAQAIPAVRASSAQENKRVGGNFWRYWIGI